jgi:hypothetical protein
MFVTTEDANGAMHLREYVDIVAKGLRERIDGLENQISLSLEAHNKAHEREHAMTETAVTKAEESMTMRLESMNEFRQQITNERAMYLTRDEFTRFEESYLERYREIGERVNDQRNLWSRLQGQIAFLLAVPIILSTIATVVALWQILER